MSFSGESGLRKVGLSGTHPLTRRYKANGVHTLEMDIFVVDAFTDQQFKGNSAAVVPIEDWLTDELMQNIAAENNLSETAYIKNVGANQY